MYRSARASALVLLLLPAISFGQSCVTITQPLSYGTSGAEVTALQNFLHGTYKEFTTEYVTGYFGSMTQAALQQWQKDHSIVSGGSPASTGWGVTGPRTRAALSCGSGAAVPAASIQTVSSAGGTITVSRGSRGDAVSTLQAALIFKGLLAADAATGYFGALTEAAVQKFQRAQNIVSSGSPQSTGYGMVGPRTWAAILSSLAGGVFADAGTNGTISSAASASGSDLVTASSAAVGATASAAESGTVSSTARSSGTSASGVDSIDFSADLSAIDQSLSQLDSDANVPQDEDL